MRVVSYPRGDHSSKNIKFVPNSVKREGNHFAVMVVVSNLISDGAPVKGYGKAIVDRDGNLDFISNDRGICKRRMSKMLKMYADFEIFKTQIQAPADRHADTPNAAAAADALLQLQQAGESSSRDEG